MKKLLGIVLSAAMLLSMAACGSTAASSAASSAAADSTADAATATDAAASDLKVGVITIGDETEGYTAAHINGIKAAAQKLGMSDSQIVWKYKVPEGAECSDAAEDLVGQGCNLVVSNSYGHQTYIVEEAEKYPDVTFVSMTGDFAALTGLDNFKNAFTNVYESRYVAGVVAGMKLQELVESGTLTPETQPNSFTADGKVKIGYVGAFTYAEVVSGYTSFFLGARSVCPTATMEVTFTGSWYDEAAEKEAANKLIANDCKLISQHADSMGAPTACETKGIPNVSYNGSTLAACPKTFIVSSRIDWTPYMTYMIECVANGKAIDVDWCGGITEGSVVLTDINEAVAAKGTAEAIKAAEEEMKAGTLHVFDTAKDNYITVKGEKLSSYMADVDTDADYTADTEAVSDGYFHESEYRSAPYFNVQIDGITLLNSKF